MKALCSITDFIGGEKSFALKHMFESICEFFPCYYGDDVQPDTTHFLIFDVNPDVNLKINKLKKLRNSGIKIISFVFDPAKFNTVKNWINFGIIDKVVVFDSKFLNSFGNVETYFSDYFFNVKLFPDSIQEKDKIFPSKVCVFGHLYHGRNNNFNCEKVDGSGYCETNIRDIYKRVINYNGVAVFDTGLGENNSNIVQYNKAKGVESLMCGVNAYCKDGIKTKRYDSFLKKYDDIPKLVPIEFEQKKIWELNEITLKELVSEL